jgi:hypothetical protein
MRDDTKNCGKRIGVFRFEIAPFRVERVGPYKAHVVVDLRKCGTPNVSCLYIRRVSAREKERGEGESEKGERESTREAERESARGDREGAERERERERRRERGERESEREVC